MKRIMKINRIMVLFILVFCLNMLVCPVSANAMNLDYLSAEKWINNSNVTMSALNKSSIKGELKGKFGYYGDPDEMCVYTYFGIKETSYSSNADIRINYHVSTPNETIDFSVDKNGICDSSGQAEVIFDVKTNFEFGDTDGYFLSAAQYKGKTSVISVAVDFYINSRIYRIKDGIVIEKPSTTKAEKTTAAKQVKTTKKSKKSAKKASASKGAGKYIPSGNGSKYKAKGNSYSSSSDGVNGDGTTKFIPGGNGDAASDSEQQIQNDLPAVIKTANHFSKSSIILFILASVLVLAAIVIITFAAVKKEPPAEDADEKGEEKNETDDNKRKD